MSWWRRTSLEDAGALDLPDDLSPQQLRARRDRLEEVFRDELAASSSINSRGTTFAGLTGATLALVAGFAAQWLDPKWRLGDAVLWVLRGLLALSIVLLLASAVCAVRAVWPRSRWRRHVRCLVRALAEPGGARRDAQLTLAMTELQRATNETKARWMRWSYVLLGLGLAPIFAQAGVFALAADPKRSAAEPSARAPRAAAEQRLAEQRLAEQHAPVFRLHPDERFGPIAPDDFLAGSTLRARRGGRTRTVAQRVRAAGLLRERSGLVRADLDVRPFGGGDRRPRWLQPRDGLFLDLANGLRSGYAVPDPPAPVFYEFRGPRITYWLLFGFHQPVLSGGSDRRRLARRSHEADWVRVDVVPGRGVQQLLLYGTGAAPRRARSRARRPVIHLARGSHAPYLAPGRTRVGTLRVDERAPGGARWSGPLRPARAQGWYGFGGAWGAAGRSASDSGVAGPGA